MEVTVSQAAQIVLNESTAYTTSADFCRIFAEDMDSLYLLGYLLTADTEKAEQCFVAGIGDCVEGNAVFKEWARSWARRVIVQHAIQLAGPSISTAVSSNRRAEREIEPHLKSVLDLDTLERFVFVMSVLEGYSHQDCSILLGCSRQAIVNARARAIDRLAAKGEFNVMPADAALHSGLLASN
jgi:hypothetical protein